MVGVGDTLHDCKLSFCRFVLCWVIAPVSAAVG